VRATHAPGAANGQEVLLIEMPSPLKIVVDLRGFKDGLPAPAPRDGLRIIGLSVKMW
jgi:hypothetical protein